MKVTMIARSHALHGLSLLLLTLTACSAKGQGDVEKGAGQPPAQPSQVNGRPDYTQPFVILPRPGPDENPYFLRSEGLSWDDPAPFLECIDDAAGGDYAANLCVGGEQDRMNIIMDEELRAAMAKLPPDQGEFLKSEQDHWTAQLSDQCFAQIDEDFGEGLEEYEEDGNSGHRTYGTMEWLFYYWCELDETEKRIRELKKRYADL